MVICATPLHAKQHAVIAIPEDYKHDLRADLNIFAAEVQAEYAVVDPGLQLILESENTRTKAIDKDTTEASAAKPLRLSSHGVYAMSQDIPRLVETSTNLASVKMKPGNIIRIETSQRSSTRLIQARYSQYGTYRIRYGRCQSYLR